MIVRVIDKSKFKEKQLVVVYNNIDIHREYEVLAIIKYRKNYSYLIEREDNRLSWFNSKIFDILDNKVSTNWITVQYKRFHTLKNKNYDFSIPVDEYQGPKEFLENVDFLFDIYEGPITAYAYYKRCKDLYWRM